MNGILSNLPQGALMDPREAMITQMGLGLLANSGPSLTPSSFGANFGKAGMQGLQAYQQAQQGNQQQQLFQMKLAEVQREAAERKKKEEALAALRADPKFAGLGPLLDVAPAAAIERALPKTPESPFAKPNPKDYTPDSIRKFLMTKNPADLVAAADPAKAPAESDLARLTRERDALPTNHPNRPLYDAKIKKLTEQAPPITVQNLPPDKKFEWEDKLRSDYKTDVKAFREVEDAHRIIQNALKNPSPANDMAAATKFMKLLDPGSVVRESELSMAMQASGVLDRMTNYHNMLLQGHKLTPQQRLDFAAAADTIYGSVQSKWSEMDTIYDEAAKSYGLDPRRVKMGGGSSKPPKKTSPQVEDWVSRAMKRNMVSREVAIKEGKRLGKVPEDY
jgi:hypothetical protein